MNTPEEALRAASKKYAFWESCEDGKNGECLTCDYESQRIVEAAMPHIRNQIAEEILARVDSPADSEQAELVNAGLRIAANIVEGNDR